LESQLDAANLISGAKTQSNPETTVGIMTSAGKTPEVHVAPTTNLGKIISTLSSIKIFGKSSFTKSLKIAQLAIKRKSSDPSQGGARRIIAFVASPIEDAQEELETLGAKLKKSNIAVDIISFGEERYNSEKLEAFLLSVNSDDKSSHLVTIPPGPHLLSDILLNSPVILTEGEIPTQMSSGGHGNFDFGSEAQNDPELMMALRMSMEEEARRLERSNADKGDKKPEPSTVNQPQFSQNLDKMEEEVDDDAMLQEAIKLSMQQAQPKPNQTVAPKQDKMEEEYDQDLYEENDLDDEEALRMAMELSKKQEGDEKISDILADEDFLNSVLGNLPKDEKKKDEKKDEKK